MESIEKAPRTRQEAFILDLIGDVVTLDGEIQNLRDSFNNFKNEAPKLADKEMRRASDSAIEALSARVAVIAQRIAGDAAETESRNAFVKASVYATAALFVCSLVLGGGGYALGKSISSFRVTAAEKEADSFKKQMLDLEKKSNDKIAKIQSSRGWLGTPSGILAKKFFESGDGEAVAQCADKANWEIKSRTAKSGKTVKYCFVKRKPFMGDGPETGWIIP